MSIVKTTRQQDNKTREKETYDRGRETSGGGLLRQTYKGREMTRPIRKQTSKSEGEGGGEGEDEGKGECVGSFRVKVRKRDDTSEMRR